jgi:hypothetical protein
MMKVEHLLPRALIMMSVAFCLLGGLGSGLARLGWDVGSPSRDWMLIHGPLMICGFLGTLICMERAVALSSHYRWSILVPAINALGAAMLLIMRDAWMAKFLLLMGSLGLVGLFVLMIRRHPSLDVAIMAAGALCLLAGNRLWLAGEPVYQVVHLWAAFLILTIVGERLELSRIRRLSHTGERLLLLSTGIYLIGVILTIVNLDAGIRVLGIGAILMAGWLLRYDITRRTIRQTGLPRYIAACMLMGYVWLSFGGIIALWKGAVYAGPDYAVILHAFLLGFVFSMIFGHAPIIIPALTGLQIRYTPAFYGHWVLLHVTLAYRMYGNFAGDFTARQYAGLLNVTAVLLFLGVMVINMIQSRRTHPATA